MPESKSFVHLHSHSQYSMLDGAAGTVPLLKAVAEQGMPAIAVTDHGSMAGTYDFWKASQSIGVKFIPGCELYLSPRVPRNHRAPVKWSHGGEDDVSGAGAYTHLTVLAESTEGMHNLFRVSSEAFLTGIYRKPRADMELLSQHSRGVIATTGCPSGEIQTWLRIGNYEEARASAGALLDIFGRDNLYVEVMDHGLGIERRVSEGLLRLSRQLGIPCVATNDLHYVHASDARTHEALLCVQSGSTLDDPNRFRFDSDTFYLRTAAEMRALFDETIPEACDNTLLIAERCSATFEEGGNLMPVFPTPEGHTEETWLAHEVHEGLKARYPDGIPDDRLERADYELRIINQMGFPSYFLVVADFIRWSKDNGIRVGPGRGSAAGSLVAYALGITDLDPIRHGLLFERFLNPERVSMPDIDIDFDEHRRGEVIEYVIAKYGADKVASITTIMQVKAKAAIKDAARVLGYPYALGDQITKTYPQPSMGRDLSLTAAFDKTHERFNEAAEFRELVASSPDVEKVVELARGLEGAKRGHGMHAAGIIMSRDRLVDHIPLMRRDTNSPVMTAFEYPVCESLGLLKMDFLGLSNLTTIDEALRQVERNRNGLKLDLESISHTLDDAKTYRLLAAGDTLGVFQLDSAPIRSLLRLINPDRFDDISAVLALYRPGPMGAGAHLDYADRKNGRKPVTPIHPELEEPLSEILSDTYGLIVYQEQVMAIAQAVGGYSLGQADLLRRAMGKKKKEILDKEFAPFASSMTERGFSGECIKTLWDVLVPFSDYAFNRSHSAGYAVVSYLTAYLKANFPAEYMAALLTTNAQDKDKLAIYLGECRRLGISVLSPDINHSVENFAAVGNDIRVGLVGVKNVGHAVVESILETREREGAFSDFSDFLVKAEPQAIRKKAVESLIYAGAFDSFGKPRRAYWEIHESAIDAANSAKKHTAAGQDSLFAGLDDDPSANIVTIPDVPEWPKPQLLAKEREMLGLYVSDHPLSDIARHLHLLGTTSTIPALLSSDPQGGSSVRIAGCFTSVERRTTKKGDLFANATLEDLDGQVPVSIFPRTFDACRDAVRTDAIVVVDARVERRDDGSVSLTANNISLVNTAALMDPDALPLELAVPQESLTADIITELKEILRENAGRTPVHMRLIRRDGTETLLSLGSEFSVTRSNRLVGDLKALIGLSAVPDSGDFTE